MKGRERKDPTNERRRREEAARSDRITEPHEPTPSDETFAGERLGISEETAVYHYVERKRRPGERGISSRTTTNPDPDLNFDGKLKWEMTLGRLMDISGFTAFWHDGELYSVRRSLDTLKRVN